MGAKTTKLMVANIYGFTVCPFHKASILCKEQVVGCKGLRVLHVENQLMRSLTVLHNACEPRSGEVMNMMTVQAHGTNRWVKWMPMNRTTSEYIWAVIGPYLLHVCYLVD